MVVSAVGCCFHFAKLLGRWTGIVDNTGWGQVKNPTSVVIKFGILYDLKGPAMSAQPQPEIEGDISVRPEKLSSYFS